jgi:adenosylmethionine-8-amino-7-oxononanoate aminotransferase
VLDIFEQDDILASNRSKASKMTQALSKLAAHPLVKNFRHLGMIWAFEAETNDVKFGQNFHKAALERSLLLRPIGNTVYLMPPYVISEQEIFLLADEVHGLLNLLILR